METITIILITQWRGEDCYVPSWVMSGERSRHSRAVWLIHFLLCCITLGHSITSAWVLCKFYTHKKTAVASKMCTCQGDVNPADFSLWFFEGDNPGHKHELKCVGILSAKWWDQWKNNKSDLQCLWEQEQPCSNARPKPDTQRRQIPHLFQALFYDLPDG